LGFTLEDAEKLLTLYDYKTALEVVRQVEKNRKAERAAFKSDLLDLIEGVRLAYCTTKAKDGFRIYKRFFRDYQNNVNNFLGVKAPTVWDTITKSKRI
jgi:hypothetical protein